MKLFRLTAGYTREGDVQKRGDAGRGDAEVGGRHRGSDDVAGTRGYHRRTWSPRGRRRTHVRRLKDYNDITLYS
jgi:hypothetical protein